jgi:hypothetical protein
MAELELYLHDDPAGRQGFKTILTGPAHPAFCTCSPSAKSGHMRSPAAMPLIRSRISTVF